MDGLLEAKVLRVEWAPWTGAHPDVAVDRTTPPAAPARALGSPAPKRRGVTFAPTKSVIRFARTLDGSKVPSDAWAPLGLGAHVRTDEEPLEQSDLGLPGAQLCTFVPAEARFELLAADTTTAEFHEAAVANRAILQEIQDTRANLIASKRAFMEYRASMKRQAHNGAHVQAPPAKRAVPLVPAIPLVPAHICS
jgi:hypothetical protein